MKKLLLTFFALFIFLNQNYYSQNFGKGLILEDESYRNAPSSAKLMRGDYLSLPDSFSIKVYCPTPKSQGNLSTCTAWATAYAGNTMLKAIAYNWSKEKINQEAFSPSFVYNILKIDESCDRGLSLIDALDVVKNIGSVKYSSFGYECDKQVKKQHIDVADENRIFEYRELFWRKNPEKIKLVKKAFQKKSLW